MGVSYLNVPQTYSTRTKLVTVQFIHQAVKYATLMMDLGIPGSLKLTHTPLIA